MYNSANVISLEQYQKESQQALLDDVSAQTFMFLREQAQEHGLPMKAVLLEHLLGIALVIKAVEGKDAAAGILRKLSHQLTE